MKSYKILLVLLDFKIIGNSGEHFSKTNPGSDNMITPLEFLKRWNTGENGKIISFSLQSLANVNIDSISKEFLIIAGLPVSSAPFLVFEAVRENNIMAVSERFGLCNEFNIYKYIGSNGSGDPFCINERNGSVVYLNRNYDFKEVLVNSSIPLLAESLLIFSQLVEESIKENGSWAFIRNNIPVRLKDWITRELERIDPEAVKEGCFWNIELARLKSRRQTTLKY